MKHRSFAFRGLCALVLATSCFIVKAHAADNGCRTGGTALADVYVLANPVYSFFFGNLESYVAGNAEHFRPNGDDAIRCAAALSSALLGSSIQLYNPDDLRRKQELDARLGAMCISPGQQQPTLSSQLYGTSMQLGRLARVLPAAAAGGNFDPLRTPTNELEQMQIVAGQLLHLSCRTRF